MKRNTIKLNENTLRQIVAESVKKVLEEVTVFQSDGTQQTFKDLEKRINLMKKILGDVPVQP